MLLETQEEFLGEEIVQLQLRSAKMSLYILGRRFESCFMRLLSFVHTHVEPLNWDFGAPQPTKKPKTRRQSTFGALQDVLCSSFWNMIGDALLCNNVTTVLQPLS